MLNHRTEIAMDAVKIASELCVQVQSEMVSSDAIEKRDRSPVTVADFGSQALICKAIAESFPDDIIIAEEDAQSLKQNPELLKRVTEYVNCFVSEGTLKNRPISSNQICNLINMGSGDICDSFWTLDPIDGTKGFLRQDQYAIALAWIVKGEVQLGVLGCPNLPIMLDVPDPERGCLFVAVKDEGTTMYTSHGEFIGAAKVSEHADRLAESYESTHGDSDTHKNIANRLGFKKPPLQIDSQAKYGIVARGEASLYLRLPNPAYPHYRECIWDHAAGQIIVEEAGGTVTDAHGKPLSFLSGKRMINNRGVVATNGKLHAKTLSTITVL